MAKLGRREIDQEEPPQLLARSASRGYRVQPSFLGSPIMRDDFITRTGLTAPKNH